ncbi:MAG: hypothetical protein GXO54_03955 [Chloroflexi bacterium]|nr:hypothetical protein [Chloroflexota bacterium]
MRGFLSFSWFLFGLLALAACQRQDASTGMALLPPPGAQSTPFSYNQGIPPTVTPTPRVSATPTVTPTLPPTVTPTPLPYTAVHTPTFTVTANPGLWPSGPGQARPGPRVVAYPLPHPPSLDGSPDDWGPMPLYAIRHVTYGRAHYQGPQDLSGVFLVGWDVGYLYLWVHVTDDVYVQEGRGPNIFRGDSAEVLLDTRLEEDYFTHTLSADDMQIGFMAGNPPGFHPDAWQWYPRFLMGYPTGVQVAASPAVDGYQLEIAIPWGRLNLRPREGLRMGFAISISDNDTPGTLRQETLISNSPYRRLTDPTTWGELLLEGGSPR